MIQLRLIPVNIMRASDIGLATLTAVILPISAQAQPTPSATAPIFSQTNVGSIGSTSVQCTATTLNTCGNRTAMRPLTAKEVELLMGANSESRPSQSRPSSNPYSSHGSCNAASCHVTATPPDSSPPPSDPISSSPPVGGGGGGWSAPDPTQQEKDIKCAEAYATTTPNPKFNTTFTDKYGWSSKSKTTGLTLEHATTDTDNAPGPPPAGGGPWLIDQGTTWFDAPQPYTQIYMYAYRNPDDIIGALAHEWYHQDNDVPGESAATEKANENKALAAGDAAKAAYDADNGAKCN